MKRFTEILTRLMCRVFNIIQCGNCFSLSASLLQLQEILKNIITKYVQILQTRILGKSWKHCNNDQVIKITLKWIEYSIKPVFKLVHQLNLWANCISLYGNIAILIFAGELLSKKLLYKFGMPFIIFCICLLLGLSDIISIHVVLVTRAV